MTWDHPLCEVCGRFYTPGKHACTPEARLETTLTPEREPNTWKAWHEAIDEDAMREVNALIPENADA